MPHPDPRNTGGYSGVKVARKGRSEAEATRKAMREVQRRGFWDFRGYWRNNVIAHQTK